MVEIFTEKKNRFGKSLIVGNKTIQIDAKGHSMVPEDIVSQALISGFELVDKTVKFETEEEQKHVKEVNDLLECARQEAKSIIAEAEKKAKEIISQAEIEAGKIHEENQVDEKEAKKAELSSKKVDDLKALCADAGIPEEDWKNLKKAELVDLLMKFIFED